MPSRAGQYILLYQGEGMNSSVAVTEIGDGIRNFHVSGKIEASTEGPDMRLQRMLGHIPALVHPEPKSVLVVGCGAGVTAGSFLVHPSVERVVICEIEPLIPRVVAEHFATENYGVVKTKRLRCLRRCPALYPHHARKIRHHHVRPDQSLGQRGSHALYREYFELCKSRSIRAA